MNLVDSITLFCKEADIFVKIQCLEEKGFFKNPFAKKK